MYRKLLTAALAAAVLWLPAGVLAGTTPLVPTPPDLGGLDHQCYYVRGPTIEEDLTDKTITGAILRFDDIRNGTPWANVLHAGESHATRDSSCFQWCLRTCCQ